MIQEEYPEYGGSHDPDDLAARNFDVSAMVARVGQPVALTDVFLDSSNTDSALVISAIAYDEDRQRVSYRVIGGTRTNQSLKKDGVTLVDGYLLTCRITFAGGLHYDQSALLRISPH